MRFLRQNLDIPTGCAKMDRQNQFFDPLATILEMRFM
jgi:hypothetical protein